MHAFSRLTLSASLVAGLAGGCGPKIVDGPEESVSAPEAPAPEAPAPEAPAPETSAPEASALEAPAVDAPAIEAASTDSPKGPVHDIPADQLLDSVDAAAVVADPMQVLFRRDATRWDTAEVTGWLAANPKVYNFLPADVRARPAIQQLLPDLALRWGVEFTEATDARAEPSSSAPVARFPSDTTNGYVHSARAPQTFPVGARSHAAETREIEGVDWIRVTTARSSSREADRSVFEDCENVGGIAFEDFSLAQDAGWVPASVTRPAPLVSQCGSDLYTFRSVSNGDLAIYLEFDEARFEGFDEASTAALVASEAGSLKPGDQVRVMWCGEGLMWLPFSLPMP